MNYELLAAVREMTVDALADVALRMAELHPDSFEAIVLGAREVFTVNGTPVTLTPATVAEVKACVKNNQKVAAIKLVRQEAGLSLKDAKDLVEQEWY